MLELNTIGLAFGLTLMAGLCTGIGSLMACCTKHTNTKFFSTALGFSAGVMIYISFVELFPEAKEILVDELGEQKGSIITLVAFLGAISITALIDRTLPSMENPHEMHHIEEMGNAAEARRQKKLLRIGLFTCMAIAIHNFPEGLATFVTSAQDLTLGIGIAIAIAIHNIPEGIAISIPIYYATKSRRKAFRYSFLSGFAEPLGALAGYFALSFFLNHLAFGVLLGSVAGIMVFISIDQLLPAAREYGEAHLSLYGLIAGMMTIALSLIALGSF